MTIPDSGLGTSGVGGINTDPTVTKGGDPELKERASVVKEDATEAGQRVTGVAKDEAGRVAHEAGSQARKLAHQVRDELTDQASTQQHRVAQGLQSVSTELQSMASSSEQQGMASDLVQQVAGRVGRAGDWLDAREPGSLLDEVTRFARRRPGVFIAVAAGAGILVGRLARALTAGPAEETTPVRRTVPTTTTDLGPGNVADPLYRETERSMRQGGDIAP